MKKPSDFLQEAKELQERKIGANNYSTMTSAIDSALDQAKKQGFDFDADELFRVIGTGPKRPSAGKTNRYTLTLYKDGKEVKNKALHVQVYGNHGKNREAYELNHYIS